MLLVFGSINVDFTFPVPHLPATGETVWSDGLRTEPGGRGANQAMAAAKDGAAVRLVGAVGQDVLADAALAGLAAAGVDLRVARLPGDTGRAAINLDPRGYTTVTVAAGANLSARADQVLDDWLGPAVTLLVQLENDIDQTGELILRARRRGARVILHLSPPRALPARCLQAADIVLGNIEDLAWFADHLCTGGNAASLRAALGCTVIRLKGVQGADAAWERGYLHVDAMPVHARDTTGAADCFTGVFAAGCARGLHLPDAMRRALVAAALSTTRIGARAGLPCAAQIDAALAEAPHVTNRQPQVAD